MNLRSILFFCCVLLAACSMSSQPSVVVGSKSFTEQLVLGELMAQSIEAKAGLKVDRRFNLAGTFICHQGIVAGEIDLYAEYTGTALTAVLKAQPSGDAAEVYRRVQREYRRLGIEWLAPFGFDNTFALVIRGEDARRLGVKTISQAAVHSPLWRAAFGYEFNERADGYRGLAATYGLRFAEPAREMDLGLIYRALEARQVDLVVGNSTDGVLSALDVVVLEDDRRYFPPYQAVPVVRVATLQKHPELREALAALGGAISAKEMQLLNQRVDAQQRAVEEVAREFLQSKGLVR